MHAVRAGLRPRPALKKKAGPGRGAQGDPRPLVIKRLNRRPGDRAAGGIVGGNLEGILRCAFIRADARAVDLEIVEIGQAAAAYGLEADLVVTGCQMHRHRRDLSPVGPGGGVGKKQRIGGGVAVDEEPGVAQVGGGPAEGITPGEETGAFGLDIDLPAHRLADAIFDIDKARPGPAADAARRGDDGPVPGAKPQLLLLDDQGVGLSPGSGQ